MNKQNIKIISIACGSLAAILSFVFYFELLGELLNSNIQHFKLALGLIACSSFFIYVFVEKSLLWVEDKKP